VEDLPDDLCGHAGVNTKERLQALVWVIALSIGFFG